MKIAIIGADGQLGSDLVEAAAPYDTVPLVQPEFEVTDRQQVTDVLRRIEPRVVINTAAFHKVDDCERDEAASFLVNAAAPGYLADTCKALDAALVHISTDYVFDGAKKSPYREDDPARPLNIYGISKLAGEFNVMNRMEKYYIIRTSGLYGLHLCLAKGGNFIDLMFRLSREKDLVRVVDDEILTPTYTADLAAKIMELLSTDAFGLYHITNSGACSWYEFARAIFDLADLDTPLERTTSDEFPSSVERPDYSVLENHRLKAVGLAAMRPWRRALAEYLDLRRKKDRGQAL
jgi:dTDP-4-dehydrorhamnose reductase